MRYTVIVVVRKELKMARIDRPVGYRVDLIEYERGWGSKVDETIYFDNETEAREYVKNFNAKNTEKVVPDWYMIADYRGKI
jgi:hypothetical protein